MTGAATVLVPALGVWLVAAAATALVVSGAWRFLREWIAGWHAVDRDRMVSLLAVSPVVLPTLVVLLTLLPGLLGLVAPPLDHCAQHADHPHLCPVHPTAAMPPLVSLAFVSMFGAAVVGVMRFCFVTWRRTSPLRSLAALATTHLAPRVRLVVADRPFAFTFGLIRTRALVSSALLEGVGKEQGLAVIQHEAEHARRADPLRQTVAAICSVPIVPNVRRELLRELVLCAEQACDERASLGGHGRVAVARTIIDVERMMATTGGAAHPAIAGIGGSSVATRVETLLREPAPRWSGWVGLWLVVVVMAGLATVPLHHGIEHVLALIFGAR